MDEKDLKKSKEILINLYQSLKIRKLDEVNNNFIINKNQLDEIDENSFEEEKKYLQKLSILTLTEYIDSAIGVIVNLKIEDELNKKNKERSENYEDIGDWETLLRKEEEDIRMYISNELKLKLYIDQMEEKMETLEKEKKSLSLKLENMKSLESEVNNYKEKVKLLNKLIEEYEEREKRLINENKQLKINIKEEGTTAAPILREEGILHSCSSISNNKISEPSKRIPMANKESKYVTPIVFKKIKSKKISRKNHTLNSNYSSINTKRNDSSIKTKKNDDARSTIEFDKNNTSAIYVKNEQSLQSFTMKNIHRKKRKDSSHSRKKESQSNSFLNNSQLFGNQNNYMKIFDKLEIYKKILGKKIRNISKKKKNQYNTYKSNSAIILSTRDKKNYHSHSLENYYYSSRPKNAKNTLKTMRNFSLNSLNGKNKCNTKNMKNKNSILKQKILSKNKEMMNIQQIINRTKNRKNSRHRNQNNIPRNDNDSSLKYLLFKKASGSNSANKKKVNNLSSYCKMKI